MTPKYIPALGTGVGIFDDSPVYMACIADLIGHEAVQSMANYTQHGETTCLDHCLWVSYRSFLVCRALGLDYVSAARGGLLHDFFLYDWHDPHKPYHGLHGINHPKIALKNATQYFDLNACERDIISRHMWPLTVIPPRYPEGLIVSLVDKQTAAQEFFE